MGRLPLAGAMLALLLGSTPPAHAAETLALGYEQDTGPNPSVFFAPETVERAVSFQASFTANPVQTLAVESYIDCTRGPESVSDKKEATITPPYAITIPSTLPDADSCWITLSAEPPCCDGEDDPGTIRVEATALREPPPTPLPSQSPTPSESETTRSYWQRCGHPGWLARGTLRTHGDHLSCRRARRIVTGAWRQPKRTGHVLWIGRWRCVRGGHGRRARVRCVNGREQTKLVGMLRRR